MAIAEEVGVSQRETERDRERRSIKTRRDAFKFVLFHVTVADHIRGLNAFKTPSSRPSDRDSSGCLEVGLGPAHSR